MYISVDETTDVRGCFVSNIVIGILHPENEKRSFLMSCKSLENTNHDTIVQFVNDSLKRFYNFNNFEEKILLVVTDAAPYMVKTASI